MGNSHHVVPRLMSNGASSPFVKTSGLGQLYCVAQEEWRTLSAECFSLRGRTSSPLWWLEPTLQSPISLPLRVSGATDINRDQRRPWLHQGHEPRHGSHRSPGPDITMTPNGNEVPHLSPLLICFTSSDTRLSIGHAPFYLCLSLPYYSIHLLTIACPSGSTRCKVGQCFFSWSLGQNSVGPGVVLLVLLSFSWAVPWFHIATR